MKYFFIIILTITYYNTKAEDCFCEKDSIYNNFINCEPDILDNGAKIYWSFNCDSSWLTFENKGKKLILEVFDKDRMILTTRIGYVSFQEFKNSFLFESKLVSGCCQPHEFYLHDKESGKIINELGTGIYTASEPDYPFFISFVYSKDFEQLEGLKILNINTMKEFRYKLPESIINIMNSCNVLTHLEEVFNFPEFDGKSIIFEFNSYRCKTNPDTEKLIIDLTEYF